MKPTVRSSPSQQQVLRTVLNATLRLLHPICPFVTETLWLLRRLGISARGPEQVDFLRHRPVLCNEALKRDFGFAPRFDSLGCFEHYRRLRLAERG